MKKIFSIIVFILFITNSFAQSEVLYNEDGLLMGFTSEKINTVLVNGKPHDQYKVKGYFKNNSSYWYYKPSIAGFSFKTEKHPNSSNGIDFASSCAFTNYVEYSNGQPLPDDITEENPDRSLHYDLRQLIRPYQSDECYILIFVPEGEIFPDAGYGFQKRTYNGNDKPLGDDSRIRLWADRFQKGIKPSPKNMNSIVYPYNSDNRESMICNEKQIVQDSYQKKVYSDSNTYATLQKLISQIKSINPDENYYNNWDYFKVILENSGNKFIKFELVSSEEDEGGYIYFENFVFCYWKDGIHKGFNIDFNSKELLNEFKKSNPESLNKVEFPEAWSEKNRLLYFE